MKEEFKSVFEKLREKEGIELDTWGYNMCIHAFGCWGDFGTSLKLFKEMKEKGERSEPDLCTYNSLIHVLCAVGKVDDATRIFSKMQHNGIHPDTVICNSLLDGMFKARKLKEACQLFERMVQDGIRASCCAYNILIDGRDMWRDRALELVEEMEARGFVVDLVTITSLLIGLHKQGRSDWAERLMKRVKDGSVLLNVLNWRAEMEARMKGPQDRSKDFTPIFPSKGDFSEIMDFVNRSSVDKQVDNSSVTDGGESQVDGNSSTTTSYWSSSPYLDQLADNVESTNHSQSFFLVSKGQRVEERGIESLDIDMVNTYLSIFFV
ncbi:hypothetical protein IFM89_003356 [Coptis chinensis]|uniref:Pentatricopeptide repeat-containing protein n=1 Tax=Coptis chinensis TaxID=261450 RepID=A0A835ISZ6_9MAGN|nr:hypothetical protein IFM89_003356 [Coptis chinensis]